MKRLILLASLIALALTGKAQNFTTGTWNKVNAKDTLVLSGRALAEVVYSVLITSKNNEIPTAKAVWDLVQSQIGDKISGTGEAPRVAYFTNNDEIGGDPDLLFDDADNILNVQDIILDGSNNAITAESHYGRFVEMSGANAGGSIKTTSASSAANGGFLILGNDDGAALANGHQLGKIAFSGNTGAATGNEGATIEAYAEGTYTGSSQPTGIRLTTIPNGSNVGVQRVWISENGDLSILGGKEVRYWDSDGSNHIGFKAPSLTSNYTYTLPSSYGTNGYQLTTDGSGGLTWTEQAGAVSQPNLQIVSGTGSGLTSNADFTHDIANDIIEANDTLATYKPAMINTPEDWRGKMLGRQDMGFLATHEVLSNARTSQISLTYESFNVAALTTSSSLTACPSIRFNRVKVASGVPVVPGIGEPLGFFAFQSHKGQVSHFHDFQNQTNGGYMFGAYIDTINSSGVVGSRLEFFTKSIAAGSGSIPTGSAFLKGKWNGDIYLPFYGTARNDAGTPAVVLSVDGSNRLTAHPVSELTVSDHGALTGLSDDDHVQYLLLAGRATGQIATGGTASGDDITLRSTTNATKGDVILNDQGGNIVIGGASTPSEQRFMEPSGSGTNYTGFVAGAMGANQMYILPTDAPTNGQVLTWNTGDILSWETGGGGVTDHGALTGLGDDDHTQYLLLAGRSGGQIATGGTGSGDDLVLRSTTNSTKGDVFINDQGGNTILGGGELSNELRFMEPAGSGANYTGFKSGAMGGDQMYTLPIDAPANGEVLTWNTGGGLSWDAVDTNPNDDAPNDVSYITMANTSSLSNERALASGVNNVRVDGGPNSSVNLDVLSGVSVVSQFTSDQDNYTNSDWSTRTTHTVSSDNGMRAMTGFAALAEGTIRRLINTGTYAMYLPSEHPDSDAANRVGGTGDHILAPNKGVIEMTYIGSRWEVTFNSFNETSLGFKYKGQFYNQMPGSTNQSDQSFIGLTTAGTGAGNQNNPPDDSPNLPQSWGLLTGTTSTGSQTVYFPKNNNAFAAFGGGHLAAFGQIYVPTLSTSAQRYTAQISLTASANGSTLAVNSSVGIRYSDNVNGGEWEVFTRNSGGTETTGDSNIAVAANTVYTCAIYVDKSLTEARFFITDGTNNYVTRIAATMPASTALAGVRVIGIASVGTTSKQVAVANIGGYIIQP